MMRSQSRRAGILVPLFSIPSESSWGIGEIADLPRMARWCLDGGCTILQLLPVTEMPLVETSPYSALSAMAIDPQFISMSDVPDFVALGGERALEPTLREQLRQVRSSSRIEYGAVRALKGTVLRRCFGAFRRNDMAGATARASAFAAFIEDESWWLHEYALFRALHARHAETDWRDWPEALRDRQPEALAGAREALADEILYRQYLQWLARDQWDDARRACGEVRLFGDMPFMVGADSADVWSRQPEFRMDVSVGVPPDAFSVTGQDWQLPLYRWDVLAARDFGWLRQRGRRCAQLYDGYRVDHLVGFYRTFFRPHDGSPAAFSPSEQVDQERLGEQVLAVFRSAGSAVIAEDLGVIPDFVRASLARLGVPGYKVFRWERRWHDAGQPFIDPTTYPSASVATSGTHDTEPLVTWWAGASRDERESVIDVPSIRAFLGEVHCQAALDSPALGSATREAILQSLMASGSDYLIIPVGDIFGWHDRINQPATVGPMNWTWKLPWPVERLRVEPEAVAAATQLGSWSARHGRAISSGEIR